MKKFYYVAYGSNLNQQIITKFCPSARLCGTSTINGYTLAFKNSSNMAGYLTVMSSLMDEVPVAIYEISKIEEGLLDRYECFPTLYRKEYVNVKMKTQIVRGMLYIMNDYYLGIPIDYQLPTKDYFVTCLAGYKYFDFNFDILEQAVDNTMKRMRNRDRR